LAKSEFPTFGDYHAPMCGIYGAGTNKILDPEIIAKLTSDPLEMRAFV
jgi:hypothetical protein